MGFNDLRSFLAQLEKEGQLVTFSEEILPEPGIRGVARGSGDIGPTAPAVIIDNVIGHKGKKIAVNVHGSWANHAVMMGMPKATSLKDQFHELCNRWDSYPGELKWVKNAPCQECTVEGDDLNLLELLPLYKVNENDAGFYLSKASVVSKDPEFPDDIDKENVGIYRMQVQDGNTLAMQGLPFHDIAVHLRKAEAKNQPLPVAICLGVDPMLSFMASTPLAYDQSEYKMVSAINDSPYELTKTTDGYLDIPAGAEYVLEGEIIPRLRVPEGPFGEFPGSYSGTRQQVVIKIKKVTHRKDPIFENLYLGRPWTEIDTLLGLNTCVPLYKQIRESMPEVTAVNALYQHGLTVIIAVNPRFGGYAKSVAMRCASTPHGISYCKNIIVVDGDVDPFDLNQVMWAMSTRLRGAQDIIVIPSTPGMPLDPGSEPAGMGVKIIIDATTPVAPEVKLRDTMLIEKIDCAEHYQKLIAELQAAL